MILPKEVASFFMLLALSGLVKAEQPSLLTLQSALEIAVQDNPSLAQMQARSAALAAIPSQVGSLPDPVISFNALNLPVDTFDIAQEEMTQLQGGISQAIPFPGKLALRQQAATYQADAANLDVTETRFHLLRDVKQSWWTLFYLNRAVDIIISNQNLLRQFIKIARTKYEVGEGLQQDVLLAQLELSRLLDDELKLQGAKAKAKAQLNGLLNKPANNPARISTEMTEDLPVLKIENDLYQLAENNRAILSSRRKIISGAQSRLDLAKKDFYPDFKIGAFYGGREESLSGRERADFLSLSLSINVPIFAVRKQQKAVDQRSSELMQQRYALQDQWNTVRAEISMAYSDYHQSKSQFVLFKSGIIPQARQTVASMLAGYQVNKVDFLNLVRTQVTLYNYEIQYWLAFTQANQALAQLTAVVGKEEIYE